MSYKIKVAVSICQMFLCFSLKENDGADYLLCHEKKGLNELKQELETLLRDTLNQLQV